MDRGELDALVDERIRYTVHFAAENSPFYRKWFRTNKIDPSTIREHEDLRDLPIISGKNVREGQPPETEEFEFKCIGWPEVYTAVSYTHLRAHETPEHLVCRLLLEKKKKKQEQH